MEKNIPACTELCTIELFVFKLIGLSSLNKAFDLDLNRSTNLKIWEIFLFFAALGPFLFLFFSLVTTIPQYLGKDFSLTCDNLSVLFTTIIITTKLIVLWYHRLEFLKVLQELNKLWQEKIIFRLDLWPEISGIIEKSKPIRYCYLVCGLSLGACYALRPHLLLLKHVLLNPENKSLDFSDTVYSAVIYPVQPQTLTGYLLLLTLEQEIAGFGIIYFILADILFIFLTSQLTINFTVMASNFENLCKSSDKSIGRTIRHHSTLLSLCQEIEYLYSPIVLLTMVFNGIDLCCCIFSFQKDLSTGNSTASIIRNLPHALTLFIQIVIYCNFAYITTESTKLPGEAIYNSPWINYDKKLVNIILIMMIRSKKEYTFTAFGLVTLNREQMSRIFNTTISYFTLLRSFAS